MVGSILERAIRRDRVVVAVALAALTALAWSYILWLAAATDPGAMVNSDMRMIPSLARSMVPARAPWSLVEAGYVFAMWAVMMVGMMTPSAAPMIFTHEQVGKQAADQGKLFLATGWFVAGYLLVWFGFALAATAAQWGLDRAALLNPKMASANRVFGGAVLIVAGLYQWTPLKNVCLAQCQSPMVFIQRHGGFRRDPAGAVRLGLRYGAYCVGCCWALMALLFVGGVMNVLWIAAISAFVLIEKVLPAGRLVSRAAGLGFLVAGGWLISTAASS
jgi:predicted metal-binding membrane protein